MTTRESEEEKILIACHKKMLDLYIRLDKMDKKKKNKIGDYALRLISGDPIYACSSNITGEQAIAIAIALGFTTTEIIEGEENDE